MSYDDNVYYHPEKHGLSILEEIEHSDGYYEYDTQLFLKHQDGRVFFAEDSGCSCPTPFESYEGIESLERVTLENFEEFEKRVLGHKYSTASAADLRTFLGKVKTALKESQNA